MPATLARFNRNRRKTAVFSKSANARSIAA
jgi:hypothetical protein